MPVLLTQLLAFPAPLLPTFGDSGSVVLVRPTHNASGFEHTTSSEFDNRSRDSTTNLYFNSFAPTRVTDTRKEGDFTHTVTTNITYDVQLPATYPRTLHRFERLRHEVTTEQRGTTTEPPIRDWITSVLSIDKYGNPEVIEEGIAAGAETVNDSAPEGLRIKSFGYMWTSNHAFEVPGLRHLPASEIDGFVLNPPGAPWATTIFNQRQTAFTYYANGTLQSLEVEPGASGDAANQNRKVVLGRDDFGNVIKRTQSSLSTSAPARIEEYIYPSSGYARGHFPIEVINEKNQHTTLQFNRNYGAIARVIDPNGLMQDFHYDDFGRMVVSVDTDLTKTTVQYRAGSATAPLQVHVRVEGGTDETSDYDVHGRSVHDSEKGAFDRDFVSDTVYDDLGRVASQTRPHQDGHIIAEATRTSFKYDALGRELRSEWFNPKPGGGTELVGNDSCYAGLVSCTRNPRGFTSCSRRDRIGRITATWDPPTVQNPELKTPDELPICETVLAGLGQRSPSTTYGYGEVLEKVTDPAGNTTRIVPDLYGRTLALSDPSMGVTRSRWNGFGELERTEDAEGRVVEYQHDALGRLALRRDKNLLGSGIDGETRWFFDGEGPGDNTVDSGDLIGAPSVSVSQEGHQQRYRYNSIGQLTSIAQTLAGESTTLTISFSDYQFGRPQLLTYPSAGANGGLAVRRNYDSHGVLLAVRRDGEANALWSLTDVDAYDQSSKEESADGVVSTIGHDTLGRIESIVDAKLGTTLHQLGLVYDRDGNVATRTDGTQNEILKYDELDRIRRASTFSGSTESIKDVQVDALGNIQQRAGMDYKYETANIADPGGLFLNASKPYAVSRAGTTDFKYDRSGNMVLRTEQSGDTTRYGWTPFGKIAQVWRNAQTPAQGQDLLELSYDADGNRVVKRAHGVTTTYLGGLYERRALSTGITDHVYSIDNGQRAIAQLTLTVDSSSSTSDLVFLHRDHLGSAELLTHADGTVEHRSYGPFGEPRSASNWSLSAAPFNSTLSTGFTGHERDDEYGLTHMQGRHYDATLGRFLSADPFVFSPFASQGLNRFAYVHNNPLAFVDPSGYGEGDNREDVAAQTPRVRLTLEQVGGPIYGHRPSRASGGDDSKSGAGVSGIDDVPDLQYGSAPGTSVLDTSAALPAAPSGDTIGPRASATIADVLDTAAQALPWVMGGLEIVGTVAEGFATEGAALEGPLEAALEGPLEAALEGPLEAALEGPGEAAVGGEVNASGGGGKIVYRGGSRTPDNMTPRPGRDMTGDKRGLSTFDTLEKATPPGGKAQAIDTSKLNCLGAYCSPDGHVSLRPGTQAELEAWGATRGTGNVHEYTQEVLDAVVETVRRPQ